MSLAKNRCASIDPIPPTLLRRFALGPPAPAAAAAAASASKPISSPSDFGLANADADDDAVGAWPTVAEEWSWPWNADDDDDDDDDNGKEEEEEEEEMAACSSEAPVVASTVAFMWYKCPSTSRCRRSAASDTMCLLAARAASQPGPRTDRRTTPKRWAR
jgi:hypothetical protein